MATAERRVILHTSAEKSHSMCKYNHVIMNNFIFLKFTTVFKLETDISAALTALVP